MTPTLPNPPARAPGVRRAVRPVEQRVLGAVAAGIADHLGVPVLWVRIGFVVATWFNGAGVLAYLALWRLMPLAEPGSVLSGSGAGDRAGSPALESATRRGLRPDPAVARTPGARDLTQALAVSAVGAGVLILIQLNGFGARTSVLVPAAIGLIGVALVWRQLDDVSLQRWMTRSSGWAFAARIALGVGMLTAALLYAVSGRGWGALFDLISVVVIAAIGVGLVLGPWILRLLADLGRERRERIRSQERADVAAHLHDSVLQTLALLQKNAADPGAVATLARRQERELRAWLYGEDVSTAGSLAAALRQIAADVEQTHQMAVEVVAVGDADPSPHVDATVKAVREATVNAAKHAGVDRIDIYAEVGQASIEAFVRDRGRGFELESIAADRMGVRSSILERMRRHGGQATIRSAPGQGTEVALRMPLRPGAQSHDEQEG